MIIARAEGNPFFLEELTRAVLDHADVGTAVTVPETIQGVLMARIDRLPEAPKRLLQTAAVLGREFAPLLLEALWTGTPRNPCSSISRGKSSSLRAPVRRAPHMCSSTR